MQIARRTLLAGVAGMASTATVVSLASTGKAQSEVEMEGLSIPSKDVTTTDTIDTVELHVTANVSIESNVEVDSATLSLSVGQYVDNATPIVEEELTDIDKSYSDSLELIGNVLDAYVFEKSQFNTTSGNTTAANMYVELRLACYDEEGETLDTSSAVSESRVSITKEAITVNGTVNGTGEVVVN